MGNESIPSARGATGSHRWIFLICALSAFRASAEDAALRFQATVAVQAHPSFAARYSGQNSMQPDAESATSVVMDLSGGLRLWRGAEAWFQPELAGGRGLSSTLGIAAFPSGEVYRVGNPEPTIVAARIFLRQVIGLGGGRVPVAPAMNQLAGERDRDALTITAGKLAVPDFMDGVPLANDPHTRFMSWGLWASAAYDYPADTRGYTWGAAADLSIDWWSARAGIFLEPKSANGLPMEWDVRRARGLAAEFEARFSLGGRDGAARVLGFLNDARMGSYRQAIETLQGFGISQIPVAKTDRPAHVAEIIGSINERSLLDRVFRDREIVDREVAGVMDPPRAPTRTSGPGLGPSCA